MASRLLALLLAAPLLLLALGAGHASNLQAPLPKVNVSLPLSREVTDHTNFRGHVEPAESVDVCSRLGGEVAAVLFKPGQEVKKGSMLFRLDARHAGAALAKTEAEVERARASLRRATADLARAKRLAATSTIGKEELESAVAVRDEADAALKGAMASLEAARLNVDSTRLTAPISGRIGRPTVAAGSVVTAGARLVTIASTELVNVVFDLDERAALRLIRDGKGKKVTEVAAEVGRFDEPNFPHRGAVDLTDLQFAPATATAKARAIVPNPDGLFLPGLSARIRLVEGKPYKALLISSRALIRDAQGYHVLVVGPGNLVERRYVKFGLPQGGLLPVKDGLKATDQVVVDSTILAGRTRGGETAITIGTAVDPMNVAMPENSTSFEPARRGATSPFEKSKGRSKGKGKSDP